MHYINIIKNDYIHISAWQPFPPSNQACGNGFILGQGGEISSPGFPLPYEDNIECTWMIRVDYNRHVLIHFLELDMGQAGESHGITLYI